MRKKIMLWLSMTIVLGFVLHSCVHDDVISSSDPPLIYSKEYTRKSLWKEDETYIKNVKKIFEEYADQNYSTHAGQVAWNYALTAGDERFLEAPVIKNGKVSFILAVIKEGDRVYFKRDTNENSLKFFDILVFKDINSLSGTIKENPDTSQAKGCVTIEKTVTWTDTQTGSVLQVDHFTETHCSSGPQLPCEAIDIGMPCGGTGGNGGGSSSGGNGGGGGYPYVETYQSTPCNKLKVQTSNSTFKNNITSLEGKTGDSYESGYRINKNADGSLQSQMLQNKPGTQQVDIKAFSNTTILMHSHYDGLYPMFSPGDVIFFNQWIVWAQNWNSVATNTPKIPLNDLTFTLVTSNGNYSFNLDGTNTTAFPNYTQTQLTDLDKKYTEDYLNSAMTVGNVSGNINFDMQKLEKEFLKFMNDKMNMPGLKLYKTTDNGNTELKLVNGNRTEIPCPQ